VIAWVGFVLTLLALANLFLLGTNRVRACIRIVAFQGVLLGLLPLLAWPEAMSGRTLFVAAVSIGLKGIVFPWFLFAALRGMTVRREVEPFVGYTLSILAGLAFVGLGIWLAARAPLPEAQISPLAMPVAFATILTGLFVIVSRRMALTQLLGYLILENGIFAFAFALDIAAGFLVEMGILLDALFAVAVMGIAISLIHRTFDAIDSDLLSALKDSTS
jgi:hydrogenase-4 component E